MAQFEEAEQMLEGPVSNARKKQLLEELVDAMRSKQQPTPLGTMGFLAALAGLTCALGGTSKHDEWKNTLIKRAPVSKDGYEGTNSKCKRDAEKETIESVQKRIHTLWPMCGPEYRYMAVDECGNVKAFVDRPTYKKTYWTSEDEMYVVINHCPQAKCPFWLETLTERPTAYKGGCLYDDELWDLMPLEIKFAAQNSDGVIHVFASRPSFNRAGDAFWWSPNGIYFYLQEVAHVAGIIDMQKGAYSIIERPCEDAPKRIPQRSRSRIHSRWGRKACRS